MGGKKEEIKQKPGCAEYFKPSSFNIRTIIAITK